MEIRDGQLHGNPHSYAGRSVLVTGAFGFLGSHVTRALVAAGAHVSALDTDTSPDRASQISLIAGLRDAVDVQTGDVTNRESLRRVFSKTRFDHVFHFAAFSSVIERAAAHPTETLLVNSTGIVHLLAAIMETGQELQCFLHASTDKVYGDHDGVLCTEEDSVFRCEGPYEASKLAADLFARSYRRTYRLPVVVVRMCNVFGPYDIDGIHSRLVPRSMAAIFRDAHAPEVYEGSESHRRDYLFVDDCCRAILSLAASDLRQLATAVFNVPGVEHLSTTDMCLAAIDAAARVADGAGDTGFAQGVRDRGFATRPQLHAGIPVIAVQHSTGAQLAARIGFRPEVSVRDGLARTAEFYREFFASRTGSQDPETRNG